MSEKVKRVGCYFQPWKECEPNCPNWLALTEAIGGLIAAYGEDGAYQLLQRADMLPQDMNPETAERIMHKPPTINCRCRRMAKVTRV